VIPTKNASFSPQIMFKNFIKLLLTFEFNNCSKKSTVISGKQTDRERPEYRFAKMRG